MYSKGVRQFNGHFHLSPPKVCLQQGRQQQEFTPNRPQRQKIAWLTPQDPSRRAKAGRDPRPAPAQGMAQLMHSFFPVTEFSALVAGKPQPCWLLQKQTHTFLKFSFYSFIYEDGENLKVFQTKFFFNFHSLQA